jgi:hypothetical protein
MPDGVSRYIFNINGVENILHLPPDGFCPTTATDAQLTEYGFPDRPKDAAKLAGWQTQWGGFKYKRPAAEPTLTVSSSPEITNAASSSAEITNSTSNIIKPDVEYGQYPSQYNWSGYMDSAPGNDSAYNSASGRYYQPSWIAPGVECSWAGLGGVYIGSLIQAGTEIETSTPYAFYDYVDANNQNLMIYTPGVTINPGNVIIATSGRR